MRGEKAMWKALWKRWTVDEPAAFGDLLWDAFVVQFAAFLDRRRPASKGRRRLIGRPTNDDDERIVIGGLAGA